MEPSSPDVDEPITVVDYDPKWPALFQEERRRVETAVGDGVTRVEHFGSTAVPGMAGKPIVDLLVGVPDLTESERLAFAGGDHWFSTYSQAKGPFLAALKQRAQAWHESRQGPHFKR